MFNQPAPLIPPLGTRIRILRQARCLTLTRLAILCGTTKQVLWAIEKGRSSSPGAHLLSSIAQNLQVSVETLLSVQWPPNAPEDQA